MGVELQIDPGGGSMYHAEQSSIAWELYAHDNILCNATELIDYFVTGHESYTGARDAVPQADAAIAGTRRYVIGIRMELDHLQ